MIKINKGDVSIEGSIVDITSEFIIGLKDLSEVMKSNGLENDVLLGAIFTGMYNITGEKGHKDCYKLGKFIDIKCKEMFDNE